MKFAQNNDPRIFEDIHETLKKDKVVVIVMHDHDEDKPHEQRCYRFAYTVGMTVHGLPELLVFFPNDDVSSVYGGLLANLVMHIKDERKQSLPDGWTDEKMQFGAMSVGLKDLSVPQVYDFVRPAFEYLENQKHPMPRFQQVVIPDRNGNLPEHPEFERDYMLQWGQHLLYEIKPVLN